ncbi:cAMP-dependent protein kinase, catalytic subunit-like [Galendromus occidentalis]|uniref:cAMP-dependent protein kinase, catalytic subunit-like n=1 Tax=Galendromus occidentalis TaxID=34638 RepID=A0AAJ6QMN7_9ACAR|nr:cAMP-dependent protein kinase, catalytic subunit-like [Galendromus occidentalis]
MHARREEYTKFINLAGENFAAKFNDGSCPKVSITKITFDGEVGSGSFGEIYKVRIQGQVYAAKAQPWDIVELSLFEKNLLRAMSHPCIIQIHFTSKDVDKTFLILDFSPFGDLGRAMKDQMGVKKDMPEDICKKYVAQAILALEYVHACNIIHHDVKPENFLIFPKGRLKLSDFGVSRFARPNMTFVTGSINYISPEMYRRIPHNEAVDWWALGVMMYYMLVSQYPFPGVPFSRGDTDEQVAEKIQEAFRHPKYCSLTEDAKDFLTKILERDHTKRLGIFKDGSRDVKYHAWFGDIDYCRIYFDPDFTILEEDRLPPPITTTHVVVFRIPPSSERLADPDFFEF